MALTGTTAILSPSAATLALEKAPGAIDLYDMASLEVRGQLLFSSPVAFWNFTGDEKRFFVITRDQNAYTFDPAHVKLLPQNTSAASLSPPPPSTTP